MARKSNKNSALDGKVLQYSDLSREGRKAAEGAAFGSTSNMRTRAQEYVESGKGKPKEREALQASMPYLKDRKTTITSARNNRVGLVEKAASGDPSVSHAHENLPGAGWYFEHHRDLRNAASEHGYDTDTAITASAVMSPQNSPDNEKAAVTSLMAAHSGGKIHMEDHVVNFLQSQGHDVSHLRGRVVSGAELTPHALADLSTPEESGGIRDSVKTEGFSLKDVARGGPKGNVAKAVQVLRGEVSEQDAIDPHSSPKVHSYRDAIAHAVPDTDVHREYMLRASDLRSKIRGDEMVGQQMFDYYGKRNSEEGLLSPTRSTAEDTWMNSISHGQPNVVVPGTTTNVMKTAGTVLGYTTRKTHDGVSATPDPRMKASAVQHAVNNEATIRAAKHLGRKYGVDGAVPATLAQEVPWTVARRAGHKDPDFKRTAERQPAPDAPASRSQQFHQLGLFD